MTAITPARIAFGADGTPQAPDFGDVYHAHAGALEQARHVFLAGNGLPQRWQGRGRFVVLETGFGLGNNFLAAWQAWRDDPARCERLWFVSVEKHPPTRDDLARAHAASPLPELVGALVAAWPPLTPDMHRIGFDGGRVLLQLVFADVAEALPALWLQADAVFLDGFAPDRNPAMWQRQTLKQLARLSAPGATAATWSVAREVRDGLIAAGFQVKRVPGVAGQRELTRARFEPVFVPRPAPARGRAAPPADALVLGTGLAGAACAQALAREGVRCTVIDRHARPAAEASGNPAGLFHGTVHGDDGTHARFNRAAALHAERCYRPLVDSGRVPGSVGGLLRLQSRGAALAGMQAMLVAQGLPPGYAQALSPAQASELAGVPLQPPAWFYPGGGWLDPAALVRAWLDDPRITLAPPAAVQRLQHDGGRWRLLDADGRCIAEAPVLVLANGTGATGLLPDGPSWPLQAQRGQLTRVPAGTPGLVAPRLPLADGGYVLGLPDGDVLCGASAQDDDDAAELREADQVDNLERLARLTGSQVAPGLPLGGRVAWRCVVDDRLPLAGAVPCPGVTHAQPRRIERLSGLFVCAGLGSRGITWAPLLGDLVAGWVTGAPCPLPQGLVDALDPARFAARAARRLSV
jgi:tRNA 5-methylaminomethyl-2-thiouridine biosynthesis bifunctional protein